MSPSPPCSSRSIEERAARYLASRQEQSWSAQDQAELDAWLQESTAHEVAYLRLEYGWRRMDRLSALRGSTVKRADHAGSDIYQTRRVLWWSTAAATLATIGVATGALVWQSDLFRSLGYSSYQTEVGGHQSVPLTDGSRIELNTDTRVRTELNDRIRAVWVDRGEAYFDVVPDPSRPFVVYAGERRLTVLGTKFLVRKDANRVMIAVTEGRVQLEEMEPEIPSAPAVMKDGDKAMVAGDSTRIASNTSEEIARELTWRHGILTFDQTTLADAASEFNRYNRKKLIVSDAAAGVRIGGSFEAKNVHAFVRLLEQGFGLKTRDEGSQISVTD